MGTFSILGLGGVIIFSDGFRGALKKAGSSSFFFEKRGVTRKFERRRKHCRMILGQIWYYFWQKMKSWLGIFEFFTKSYIKLFSRFSNKSYRHQSRLKNQKNHWKQNYFNNRSIIFRFGDIGRQSFKNSKNVNVGSSYL